MKNGFVSKLAVLALLVFALTVSGVSAAWTYLDYPDDHIQNVASDMATFRYGTLYITSVSVTGGAYNAASSVKIADLDISSQIELRSEKSSSAVLAVTLYNSTDVNYYYNETTKLSHSNNAIGFTVSGIEQKQEIPPKTYKTVNVTYNYSSNNVSNGVLESSLHFNFVIDKESIGGIVAQTAVDRFGDILNNVVSSNSYDVLDTAMDQRSGFNKASAVTYIGNVSGSSNTDSNVIKSLFGEEFMTMDLDGDGKAEPITMMIKRENLDENDVTGSSYTYSNWGRETTVDGAEMTLYITSQDLSSISNNQNTVVYAAVFTKFSENEKWVCITPLTKGVAKANNYSGYGNANSFNTDTWVSDDDQSIEQIVSANINK